MTTKLTLALLGIASAWPAATVLGDASADALADALVDALVETATPGHSCEETYPLGATRHLGTRFFVDRTTSVTQIGARLRGDGRLFGAIVRLDGPRALPAAAPFGDDLVAGSTFDAPADCTDLLVDLAATIEPGHYALVFGSGAFDADGSGLVPWNGQRDLFGASYVEWRDESGWRDAPAFGIRLRVMAAAPCPADLDASADVGLSDLLILLSTWGPCPEGCPADLDANDAVDFGDLLMLLDAWGPC